jgi:two-component system response regulator RegA
MCRRVVERVLVVEDNVALSGRVCATLAESYRDVRACNSVSEVEPSIAGWWPDLVLLDVVLADGDAGEVLELLERHHPAPAVIAMSGTAGAAQSFALGARGVRAFLEKPLELDRLQAVIDHVLDAVPDLRPMVKQLVGYKALADVETEVRDVMIHEALARTGTRRGAARLLSVSRQLLQYLLRRTQ